MVLALVMMFPTVACAQARINTKRVRIADISTRTTKVVLGGNDMTDSALKEEVSARWRISPYEFCTADEYRTLITDNSYYFLSLAQDEGVVFMVLEKGGVQGDANMLKIPFEVVRIPVAAQGAVTGLEFGFFGAFIDIIQDFAMESMTSDRIGYTGIGTYNGKDLRGMKILLDPDESAQALDEAPEHTLSSVIVAPTEISFKTWCYKMLINAETHELYYYSRDRFSSPADAKFSKKELMQFERKNATVIR